MHAFLRLLLVLPMVTALLGACSRLPDKLAWPWSDDVERAAVQIEGLEGADYRGMIDTYNLDDPIEVRAPNTVQAAAANRQGRMTQALESIGYFTSRARHRVVSDTAGHALAIYTVRPGTAFTLGDVKIAWDGGVPENPPAPQLQRGAAVNAVAILAEAKRIGEVTQEVACPTSLRVRPMLTLERGNRVANLTYTVERGPTATFGEVTIEGTERVKDRVLYRALTWENGDCFKLDEIARTEDALRATQLFSSISVSTSAPAVEGGPAMVTITAKERAARRVRAGVYGSSADGLSVGLGWDHRNLLGGGESFTSDLTLGQFEQAVDLGLRQPGFLDKDQTLASRVGLSQESRDTYNALTLDGSVLLERPLPIENLRGGAGVGLTLSKTKAAGEQEAYYALVSFPGFLHHDTRDNLLDPKRGHSLRLDVTPYTETVGDGGQFVKTVASGRIYRTLDMKTSPTLAFRGTLGTINLGEGRDVPADLRFYAGGGGSVRGYGYQTLGPRENGNPNGGNSLVEVSGEVRSRFTETLGGVAFLDAGNVFEEPTPNIDPLKYAAGLGLRYQTPLGPLRADVAVPLNGDDVGAAPYALYFSIGQAF